MSTLQRDQLASHEEAYKADKRPLWVLHAARHQQGWDRLPFGHPALDLTKDEFERALKLAQNHSPGSEIELVRPIERALKEQAKADKKQEELTAVALKARAEEEERKRAAEEAAKRAASAEKAEPEKTEEPPLADGASAEGAVR